MFSSKNSKKNSVLESFMTRWVAEEFIIYTFYSLFPFFCSSVNENVSAKNGSPFLEVGSFRDVLENQRV